MELLNLGDFLRKGKKIKGLGQGDMGRNQEKRDNDDIDSNP